MKDNELLVCSDQETRKFAQEMDFHYIGMWNYFLFSWFYKKKTPIFLSNSKTNHHFDYKNIEKIRKVKNLKKKDLSIVIFDFHPDMYWKIREHRHTKREINMANWVGHLLETGYDDVHMVGVNDFTLSAPEVESKEYWRYNDQIKFYLGEDFNQEQYFADYDPNQIKLFSLDNFLETPLRDYSFISICGDVSFAFTNLPPYWSGAQGRMSLDTLKKHIQHTKGNSKVEGISLYGYYATTFCGSEDNVVKALSL